MPDSLTDQDYRLLVDFRLLLREFLAFSAKRAEELGLAPQQHQALMAIRAEQPEATVGTVAKRLLLKPNSATGLVDRLEAMGLVTRRASAEDRRRTILRLTSRAHRLLARLTATHREEIRRLRPMLISLLDQFG